jgi:hypothetical protein
MEKHCSQCDKTKPVTEFYYRSKEKQTYQPFCKECESTKKREARKKQIETEGITEEIIEFKCDKCDKSFETNKGLIAHKVVHTEEGKLVIEKRVANSIKKTSEASDLKIQAVEKKCKQCNKIKNKSEFYKKSDSADGFQTSCKECQAENKEKRKQALSVHA